MEPYWGKPAVRNLRGDDGNVGIIRSPVRAIVLPDPPSSPRFPRFLQKKSKIVHTFAHFLGLRAPEKFRFGRQQLIYARILSDNRATRSSRLVDELTEAAKRLGLEVRRERILREVGYRARGEACRLREKYLIIIDRDQPPAEQLEMLVEALRDRGDLEQLYLSPAARRILQSGPEQT